LGWVALSHFTLSCYKLPCLAQVRFKLPSLTQLRVADTEPQSSHAIRGQGLGCRNCYCGTSSSSDNVPRQYLLALLGFIVSYIVFTDKDILRGTRIFRLAVIWILIWAVGYHIYNVNFEKDMRSYYGRLYPSNVFMPDKRCGPGDDTVLFSGPNTFQTTQYPYTFLYIEGKPIISLGKSGNSITIDYLLLNDINGDNLVHISKDEFWIKPTIERLIIPDRSRLEIADHTGDKALTLYFMNSTHLYIAGKFAYHGFIVDI
jgi:hypothetical protein